MTETWRPIPGWPGYEASDLGRILSHKWGRPHVLKPWWTCGYFSVRLSRDKRKVALTVHSLVLLAFVGPRPEGQEARHLDGDSTNNVPGNLAYGTRSENTLDQVRMGRHIYASRTHCPRNHPYDEENTYIRRTPRGTGRKCRECARARRREAA